MMVNKKYSEKNRSTVFVIFALFSISVITSNLLAEVTGYVVATPTQATLPDWSNAAIDEDLNGVIKFKFNVMGNGKPTKIDAETDNADIQKLVLRQAFRAFLGFRFGSNKGQKNLSYVMDIKVEKNTSLVTGVQEISVNNDVSSKNSDNINIPEKINNVNTKRRKGPYGNTARSFGFGKFFIGMKFDVSEELIGYNKRYKFNGEQFAFVQEYGSSCRIRDHWGPKGKLDLLNTKLRNYSLVNEFDKRVSVIMQKYYKRKPIRQYRLSKPKDFGLEAMAITVENNRVIGMDVRKNYVGTGLDVNSMIQKIKTTLGNPKNRIHDSLYYEGGVNDHLGTKILDTPQKNITSANRQSRLLLQVMQNPNFISVSYHALLADTIVETMNREHMNCYREITAVAKKMIDKAESSNSDFEL